MNYDDLPPEGKAQIDRLRASFAETDRKRLGRERIIEGEDAMRLQIPDPTVPPAKPPLPPPIIDPDEATPLPGEVPLPEEPLPDEPGPM
jgi:hypothetical protein